ncbi:VOC family protein [Rhodococcus sp. P1Y]|uniref:VOC family protein n=1 Tax=Rhodococcus sp. P1Y TaxID=1302308 RepID=UPI000EABFA34|nr:VOC family protein [Rhodococcus sp. P1Y]AYJ50442.1 VOC family protein [Rhodococcus sp. P1Y]
MALEHVLAVVPVTDIDTANAWYEAFFGMPATNNPMPVLVEWKVADFGWVQVTVDEARAGSTLLNFATDDLDAQVTELASRGIVAGEIVDANKGVRLSTTTDPDGNTITLIGGFRVDY